MRRPKENRNCPYCLSPIEDEGQSIRCPKCGVVHHADCWKANGRCSVYGCDGWAAWSGTIGDRVAPDTEAAVEVTSEERERRLDEAPARCIECGAPVRAEQLVCWGCRRRQKTHRWENCAGPAILCMCGFVGVVWAIIRAVS